MLILRQVEQLFVNLKPTRSQPPCTVDPGNAASYNCNINVFILLYSLMKV